MSHSILVCEGRHEIFRDNELFAAVALLEYLMERGEVAPDVASVFAEWKSVIDRSGPGTIVFDLDALVARAGMRERVRASLDSAATYALREWKADVPASILNRYDASLVRFYSYSAENVAGALARMSGLLRGPLASP